MNIGGIPLHLRGEVRDIFFEWLRSYRPDLVPRYEQLYARGAYVGKEERERIQGSCARGQAGWRDASNEEDESERKDPVTMPHPRRAPGPVQTKLF